MKINIDNIIIEIESELLSVFHQPINVFSTDNLIVSTKISEYKNIKFNLKITSENNVWNVPYLLQLKKDLKKEFVEKYQDEFIELSTLVEKELNDYTPSKIDIFEFSKIRFLNKPYFEIFEKEFNESVFKLLNYIDTIDNLAITKEEYEHIDKSTFFNFSAQELENIQLKEEFVIREYPLKDIKVIDINSLNKYYKDKWLVPLLNFTKLELNTAKVFDIKYVFYENEDGIGGVGKFEVIKNEGSLKILLPKKYSSKYRPNFEEINSILNEFNGYTFKHFQGANIFYGTYEECFSKMNNPNEIYKLATDVFLEREEQKEKGRSSNYDLGDWGGLYGEEAETGRWNTD